MEGLIGLGVIIGVLGAACLIGWGMGALYDIYYKYRVKKNHIKHPKLIELEKEREKLCKEYHQWWDEKYQAQKRIDHNFEILRYCTEQEGEKYISRIEQDQQIYTNARKHMEELSPLVEAARQAEDEYKEKYNIRHW